MSTINDHMSASGDSIFTTSSQDLRNVFNRAYTVLDLLYTSTATESPSITQARGLLVGVVEDLRTLAGKAEWKEKKLADKEVRNAFAGTRKA